VELSTAAEAGQALNSWIEADSSGRVALKGSWRLNHLEEITGALQDFGGQVRNGRKSGLNIDGSALEEIDTAGAMLLFKTLLPSEESRKSARFNNFKAEHLSILELVGASYQPSTALRDADDWGFLARLGKVTFHFSEILLNLISFVGETYVEIFRAFLNPKRLRIKEFFAQLEVAGINAIPIVCLVTFLIGVVVAYLFGIQIQKYGANIFIVDAVGLAMCRELSPILVAIILAGRSGSAFTAQIGTMKLNEEVDALTTFGLSPMRVLVLPRVFALMIAMPLLVFVGDVMGILGSMVIADLRLDITGVTFLERLHTVLPVRSFLVGLIKAPVFAAVIAVIGCRMGLAVENNARSVGLNTTATVVRSIVAVILLNAAFAIIFVELKI
jgi:phospholipid/cholesterol/gamma-HCH transport system permease protein